MTEIPTQFIPDLHVSRQMMDAFMPMNLHLNAAGEITKLGPSLAKIIGEDAIGTRFETQFDVLRPYGAVIDDLHPDRPMVAKLLQKEDGLAEFNALIWRLLEDGPYFANLSLGLSFVELSEHLDLTAKDFAPTDPSIDLLYMVELQHAQVAECKRLTERFYSDRATARKEAQHDLLTGLSNRRALETYLSSTEFRASLLP